MPDAKMSSEIDLLELVQQAGPDGLLAREVVQESRAGAPIKLGGGFKVEQRVYERLEALAAAGLLTAHSERAVYAGRGTAQRAVFKLSPAGELRLRVQAVTR
jgi:hypothetical protein